VWCALVGYTARARVGQLLSVIFTVVEDRKVVVLVNGVWVGRPSGCRKLGVWMPVWFVSCTILLDGVTYSLLHALRVCVYH